MKKIQLLVTVSTVIYTLAIIFFIAYLAVHKSSLMALGGVSLIVASLVNLYANYKDNGSE